MRAGGVVVWLLAFGCTKPNPAVCCDSPDDCASIGASSDERTCALGLVCNEHHCELPPDAAPPECTSNGDCVPPRAVCGPAQTCVECTASSDCPSSSPVCEPTDQTCRICKADAECESGACDDGTGVCIAETDIAYASPTGPTSASCSKHDPCSIQRAFAVATGARQTVILAPGGYTGAISVSNTTVHVRGAGATLTVSTGDTFTVLDSAHVELRDLTLVDASTNGKAIVCSSSNGASQPILEARNVHVDAVRTAMDTTFCIATIVRSSFHVSDEDVTIIARQASQISFDSCTIAGGSAMLASGDDSIVHFENSVIGPPTPSGSDAFIVLGGAVTAAFSTIFDARISCSGSISCVSSPRNGFCLQNSIVANFASAAPASTVTGCSATHSLIFPQAVGVLGSGNKLNMNPVFIDPNAPDLHLGANSPAVDAADPTAAVTTDIEGTMRPVGPGPDMGAYERH